MTTYVWQFDSLDVFPTYQALTDVVESMHWRLTANDGQGHQATALGEVKAGPVDPGNFTPFSELTLPVVQGWCEAQLGPELDVVKAQLVGQLQEQTNPSVVSHLPPWA